MADKKTERMAQFYAECQKKGYTDMTDSVQSLKAKVIATDLRLNYGNIVSFYEKAKDCYEQVKKEQVEAEKERAEQEAEKARRRALGGELLITLCDKSEPSGDAQYLRVYIRPDNSIYYTLGNGEKQEGTPLIKAIKAEGVFVTPHPSKAVYTGATVGGITTGGVHHTEAGYSVTSSNSGMGEVIAGIYGKEFVVKLVTMSEYTENRFKRDPKYRKYVGYNEIRCYKNSNMADIYSEATAHALLKGDTTLAVNSASLFADSQRLPYTYCKDIAKLVNRIVHGQFPPSDEEIYETAQNYANGGNSSDLKRAIATFNSIRDFQDAGQRADVLQNKYEEMLQHEKEQAVLNKEAKQRLSRILIMIPAVFINLFVTAFLALVAFALWADSEKKILAEIAITVSAVLSIPGIGKLIFRKKYGFIQRILRWIIIVVIFVIGLIFLGL